MSASLIALSLRKVSKSGIDFLLKISLNVAISCLSSSIASQRALKIAVLPKLSVRPWILSIDYEVSINSITSMSASIPLYP